VTEITPSDVGVVENSKTGKRLIAVSWQRSRPQRLKAVTFLARNRHRWSGCPDTNRSNPCSLVRFRISTLPPAP